MRRGAKSLRTETDEIPRRSFLWRGARGLGVAALGDPERDAGEIFREEERYGRKRRSLFEHGWCR